MVNSIGHLGSIDYKLKHKILCYLFIFFILCWLFFLMFQYDKPTNVQIGEIYAGLNNTRHWYRVEVKAVQDRSRVWMCGSEEWGMGDETWGGEGQGRSRVWMCGSEEWGMGDETWGGEGQGRSRVWMW